MRENFYVILRKSIEGKKEKEERKKEGKKERESKGENERKRRKKKGKKMRHRLNFIRFGFPLL